MKFIAAVKGAAKVKDKMKDLSWVASILAFGHPILAVTTLIEDRYHSRYWHHLVIPPSVYPYTFPIFCLLEYIITANGMFISLCYLFVVTLYFCTSSAWMQLVG